MKHIDNMAKVMLATGLMVGYGYTMEAFFAWYSGVRSTSAHDVRAHDRTLWVGLLDAHRRSTSASCSRSGSGAFA